jgi:hypothetical protein
VDARREREREATKEVLSKRRVQYGDPAVDDYRIQITVSCFEKIFGMSIDIEHDE